MECLNLPFLWYYVTSFDLYLLMLLLLSWQLFIKFDVKYIWKCWWYIIVLFAVGKESSGTTGEVLPKSYRHPELRACEHHLFISLPAIVNFRVLFFNTVCISFGALFPNHMWNKNNICFRGTSKFILIFLYCRWRLPLSVFINSLWS
jgi:hypothetical protein